VPVSITGVPLGKRLNARYFYMVRQRISVPDKAVKNIRVGANVIKTVKKLWVEESGQDVAEYAVMLAVILVIVVGTVRLIGGNANNVFSQVSSQMTQ
jgi:Flp pilus assembly pilin Flp